MNSEAQNIDLYTLLNVTRTATTEEIVINYRYNITLEKSL